MPRPAKLIALAPLVLLGAYFLFVLAMRMRGPSDAQAAALDVLRAPTPAVTGRDASDAVWLLPYDVPLERRAEAARSLRDYLDKKDALVVAKKPEEAARLPDPMRSFVRLPQVDSQTPGLCPEKAGDCLAQVRRMSKQADEVLQQNEAGLRRALELADYDGFRYGLTISSSAEIPQLAPHRLLVRTYFARQFDLNHPQAAMAGLCRDIAGWRRLGADHDHLVGSMVAASYAKNDLTLMAEMLAERPADETLPAECAAALAEFSDAEKGICLSAKTEFRMVESAWRGELIAGTENRTGKVLAEAAIDEDQALAVVAPHFARFCGADAVRMADQDRAWHSQPVACNVAERIADPIGCVLAQIAGEMSLERYANRRIDLGAELALMRTVVWLRETSNDPTTWPTLLPKRPASLGLKREPKISADGARVSIVLLDQSRDEEFSLPLRPATAAITPSDVAARSSH